MHNPIPKQYMLLAGKPVILHTLEKIEKIDSINEVVVVCAEEYIPQIEEMLRKYHLKKKVLFALSGLTRQDSVFSGLKKVGNKNVIIHEAARPFVKVEEFEELINYQSENVIIGSPINYTVLRGDAFVTGLLNRSELVNVQLPQKFNTKELIEAHEKAKLDNKVFTEDASLLYYYKNDIEISIIRGKDYNIKLTTPMDMILGEQIYNEFFTKGRDV